MSYIFLVSIIAAEEFLVSPFCALLLDYNILISLFNHMTEGIKKAGFIWTSLHKCCILSAISNYFKLRKE